MSATRIATRYAKSLLDLANEQGKLESVLEDVKTLQATAQNRDVYMMLKSPIITTDKKKQVFDALFGESFDEVTMRFVHIIANKGRENILPEIADAFMSLYKAQQDITTVTVTSAQKLSDAALSKIKAKLISSAITSENVEIETALDPALLGGFVIKIGDKLYDSSVAHKLNRLRKEFTTSRIA